MPFDDTPEAGSMVESLTREIEKVKRIADLFRQQRDNAVRAVNDLQVELAEARYQIEQQQGGGRPDV